MQYKQKVEKVLALMREFAQADEAEMSVEDIATKAKTLLDDMFPPPAYSQADLLQAVRAHARHNHAKGWNVLSAWTDKQVLDEIEEAETPARAIWLVSRRIKEQVQKKAA